MPDWFLAYALLIVLMLSSFLCIGMASLWAASSRRRRLIRSAIVFLLPAPLLLRPAYELYSVFAIQSLIVFCGAAAYRRASADFDHGSIDDRGRKPIRLRFSLSTLLIVMAAVAICLAAAIELPKWENLAWRTAVISGVGAGVGTLAGAWLCSARRKWIVGPIAGLSCIAVGTAVSKLDWFFEATLQMAGWPPRPITPEAFLGSPANYDDFDAWLLIPLVIGLATALLISLWRIAVVASAQSSSSTGHFSARRAFARVAFAALTGITAAIPLAVMIDLLLPAPIPKVTMPEPNGHEDFLRAAKIAGAMNFNFSFSDIDTATAGKLAPLAADADKVDAIVVTGLEKHCYVPMDYFSPEGGFSHEQFNEYDSVKAALTSKARLAVLDRHYDDAVEVYLRAAQFGFTACRGAMVWEGGLIRARAAHGTRGLYYIRHQLSDNQLAHCIERLIRIDTSDESMDEVLDRYPVWAQRRNGWHGHLKYRLETVAVDPGNGLCSDYWHCETFRNHYRWSHAVMRLMICELALTRYHREHSNSPASLDALVPDYLPALPIDPFDSQNALLTYRPRDDGYLLYSVSENGVDNGGIPWAKGEKIPGTTGDLRLDYAFKK
jgi:hypothetical protein